MLISAADAPTSIGQLELGRPRTSHVSKSYNGHAECTGGGKKSMRLVLLKPTDNTDESEKALVGNTILVAQPSPEMIAAESPPTEAEQAEYFNVVYGAGASTHA